MYLAGDLATCCTCLHGNTLSLDVLILICILQCLLLIKPAPSSFLQRLILQKQDSEAHMPAISGNKAPMLIARPAVTRFTDLVNAQAWFLSGLLYVQSPAADLLEHVIAGPGWPPAAEKRAPAMPQRLLGRCMCASQPAGLHQQGQRHVHCAQAQLTHLNAQ